MDFPSPADNRMISLNNTSRRPSSGRSEALYPTLDEFDIWDDEDCDVSRSSRSSSPSTGSRPTSVSPPPPHTKKYLYPKKEFVEELRPEEVRWFYKQEGDKKWTAFIGYDSLRIECKYRELSFGLGETNQNNVEMILVRGGLYEADVVSRKCYPVYWTGDVTEVLRGMWFYDGTWQPIDEGFSVQIETEHLAQFVGKKLEDYPMMSIKGQKPVIHNIKFQDFYVDWNGLEDVFMFSESTSSRLVRHVSKSLGFQKWALRPVDSTCSRFRSSGTKLQRGYCYEAIMDDKPADINHMVFVIHGIGQKMDTGSIIRCCKDLRETVNKQKQKHFPKFDRTNKRSEFLPVEWRSSLSLDGDIVESITPQKVKGLREILNSSAMDILYYTSPLYRSEITHGLQTELNRLYQMFCERHPYFEPGGGKVSIVAHSLGAVITYDILAGWNPIRVYDQFLTDVIEEESTNAHGSTEMLAELDKAKTRVMELETLLTTLHERQLKKTPTLTFKVENIFCLGSPLAVFLALRGIRPQGDGTQDHILSTNKCKRIFNIYHPADPVAYRLEPLILKHYASIMPIQVHRSVMIKRVAYTSIRPKAYSGHKMKKSPEKSVKVKKVETIDLTDDKDVTDDVIIVETAAQAQQKFSFSGMWSRLGKKTSEPVTSELKVIQKYEKDTPEPNAMEVETPQKITAKAENKIEQTELEYRLDYQLKEGNFEHSYISAITSHTSYWCNDDVALFILSHLHPELQLS